MPTPDNNQQPAVEPAAGAAGSLDGVSGPAREATAAAIGRDAFQAALPERLAKAEWLEVAQDHWSLEERGYRTFEACLDGQTYSITGIPTQNDWMDYQFAVRDTASGEETYRQHADLRSGEPHAFARLYALAEGGERSAARAQAPEWPAPRRAHAPLEFDKLCWDCGDVMRNVIAPTEGSEPVAWKAEQGMFGTAFVGECKGCTFTVERISLGRVGATEVAKAQITGKMPLGRKLPDGFGYDTDEASSFEESDRILDLYERIRASLG